MKHYISILFWLLSIIVGFSQSNQDVPVYLDSVKIDLSKVYIGPSSGVDHVTHNTPTGELYITLRKNVHFLTFNDILKMYLNMEDNDNVLYYIDDKIIYDKKDVRIDSSIIKKAEKFDMSKVDYINKNLQGMIIVKIRLTTYHPEYEDSIMVRGEK